MKRADREVMINKQLTKILLSKKSIETELKKIEEMKEIYNSFDTLCDFKLEKKELENEEKKLLLRKKEKEQGIKQLYRERDELSLERAK